MMLELERLQKSIDENKQKYRDIENLKLSRALCERINLYFFGLVVSPEVGDTGRVFGIPFTVVGDDAEWSFDIK
jgi:hypothetical protein